MIPLQKPDSFPVIIRLIIFFYENRFANLIIIIRAISSPFYRVFPAELPIKNIFLAEISLSLLLSGPEPPEDLTALENIENDHTGNSHTDKAS